MTPTWQKPTEALAKRLDEIHDTDSQRTDELDEIKETDKIWSRKA